MHFLQIKASDELRIFWCPLQTGMFLQLTKPTSWQGTNSDQCPQRTWDFPPLPLFRKKHRKILKMYAVINHRVNNREKERGWEKALCTWDIEAVRRQKELVAWLVMHVRLGCTPVVSLLLPPSLLIHKSIRGFSLTACRHHAVHLLPSLRGLVQEFIPVFWHVHMDNTNASSSTCLHPLSPMDGPEGCSAAHWQRWPEQGAADALQVWKSSLRH